MDLRVFEKSIDSHLLPRYLASIDHIADAVPLVYTEGKAKGVETIRISNGTGMTFNILPSRAMDIASLEYCGLPLHFSSQTGIVHPRYYEEPERRMLRTFFGGFLSTCGLRNAGLPGEDEGERYGLHGRISNTEAENLSIEKDWKRDNYSIEIKGVMRESAFRGEHLLLRRSYYTELGVRSFRIQDTIENKGFKTEPLVIIYHINLGFPFLGPQTIISLPLSKSSLLDTSDGRLKEIQDPEPYFTYDQPKEDAGSVLIHEVEADVDGYVTLSAFAPHPLLKRNIRLSIRYNQKQLPFLSTFTVKNPGCYIFSFEPGTSTVEGRGSMRGKGQLIFLKAQEKYKIDLDIGIDI